MSTLIAITYRDTALVNLRAIEPKKIRQQIVTKVNGLAHNPKPPGCCKVQGMMEGTAEVYRLRSGDYRVLYCEKGDTELLVLDIGHRKDVYRNR